MDPAKKFMKEQQQWKAKQNFAHVIATTDNAHKQMRDQMTKPGKRPSKEEWWAWFNREWDKKKNEA